MHSYFQESSRRIHKKFFITEFPLRTILKNTVLMTK